MKRKTLLLFVTALLFPTGMRAQSTTPTAPPSAQQPVKPGSSLDDDPAFKRLSPAGQEWVRQIMQQLNKAVADKDPAAIDQIERDVEKHQQANAVVAPAPAPPEKKTASPANAPAQSGCDASAIKKPRFHIPKAMQDAINKQARAIGDKTGVDVDPNAPAQAVSDAQGKPCPPATKTAPKATPKKAKQ
jgi:hypothetical protein